MTTSYVSSGQTLSGLMLASGNTEVIEGGGIVSDGTVSAGGTLIVTGDGLADGVTVLSGGAAYTYPFYPLVGTLAGLEFASASVLTSNTVSRGDTQLPVTTTTNGGTITGLGFGSAVATPGPLTLPAPVNGVATIDLSSLDLANLLLGSGVFLQPGAMIDVLSFFGATTGSVLGGSGVFFQPGTEAVQLLDGVLSIGPDTNEAFLARLYVGLFGRAADSNGISYADALLQSGTSQSQVASDILATPAGTASFSGLSDPQFVTTLFQNFLGRAPSSTDLSVYTSALAKQASRGSITAIIATSAEAKVHLAGATAAVYVEQPTDAQAFQTYVTAFNGRPDVARVQFSAAELQGGLTPLQLAQQISITPEFVAQHAGQSNVDYVTSLYDAGLGRPPSGSELALDIGGLQSGAFTRDLILLQVASSPEAAAHLTRNV